MQMKTIKEHLNSLPSVHSEIAISYASDENLHRKASSPHEALARAFVWQNTREGYTFWRDCFVALHSNKPLPEMIFTPPYAESQAALYYYRAKRMDKMQDDIDVFAKQLWRNQYLTCYAFPDGSRYAVGNALHKNLRNDWHYVHRYADAGTSWLAIGCFGRKQPATCNI